MNKNFQLLTVFIIAALLSSTGFAKKRSVTCADYYSGKSLERKASRFSAAINHASKKYGVNRDFIKAVITIESCFKPNARGALGEKGLMQLMPATARMMGVKNGYNSWQNIDGGARYLKYLLGLYNGNKSYAAAAYNGGPGAVSKKTGPRFPQVRRYSRHVMRAYRKMSGVRDVVGKAKVTKASVKAKKVVAKKKAVKTKKTSQAKNKNLYRVQQGQTLFSISQATGVAVERLRKLNKLPSNEIKVGQVLRLKTKKSNKSLLSKTVTKATPKKAYRVGQGQTLYSISRETGVSIKRLQKLNKLKSMEIKVGQDLRLQ